MSIRSTKQEFVENLKRGVAKGPKWNTELILLSFFVLGLGLRLYRLAGYPPHVDEYRHMEAAVALYRNHTFAWGRAYLTVSLPVYLSYRIFGISLWSSRFPMVLINMLAIFPLFAISKKIDRMAGYISVGLFSLSPWIIEAGKMVRDYAVVPFFFYVVASLLIELLDWEGETPKRYLDQHKYRIAVLLLILGYVVFDHFSILKIILALYGIFGMLVIFKISKQKPSRTIVFSVGIVSTLLIVGIFLSLLIVESGGSSYYFEFESLVQNITNRYWKALVANVFQQWYYVPLLGYPILLGAGYLAFRAIVSPYKKDRFVVLFCFLAFITNLIYLTFVLRNRGTPARVRYGVLMEYWYVLVVSIALFAVYQIANKKLQKLLRIPVYLTMVALLINIPAIWATMSYHGGGRSPIARDFYYLVEPAHDFLATHMTEGDILLADIVYRYDEISGNQLHPRKAISLSEVERSEIRQIIDRYPCGWIAASLNISLNRYKLPLKDYYIHGKTIRYYGTLGEINLWRWMPEFQGSASVSRCTS